jgi:protein-tyrosine phosphatase
MNAEAFNRNGLTRLDFGTSGRIYRSPMPFSAEDPERRFFSDYQAHEVSGVVVLAEALECHLETGRDLLAFYREQGLEVIHCPIPDFGIPTWEPFDRALQAVVERAQAGEHTAVHCFAGVGRTGMFMACLAHKLLGLDGETAITWVRSFIPRAVENEYQIQFVREYSG